MVTLAQETDPTDRFWVQDIQTTVPAAQVLSLKGPGNPNIWVQLSNQGHCGPGGPESSPVSLLCTYNRGTPRRKVQLREQVALEGQERGTIFVGMLHPASNCRMTMEYTDPTGWGHLPRLYSLYISPGPHKSVTQIVSSSTVRKLRHR